MKGGMGRGAVRPPTASAPGVPYGATGNPARLA